VGTQQARSSARLSSGFRINSGADDAAGLAISEGMRSQIRGMNQASRNAQDGISLIQTAEGYASTITEMMQRARELVVQGANDTNNTHQRASIQNELAQIANEIERIWDGSTFNGSVVFGENGLLTGTEFKLQVGADEDEEANVIDVINEIGDQIDEADEQIDSFIDLFNDDMEDHDAFNSILDDIDNAIRAMNELRAGLGAIQNRLEFTIENLDTASENLSASESRIRDADMAAEMMRLTQSNVLQQAATSMLAQANQAPQSILQLLG
jgi:flagellin